MTISIPKEEILNLIKKDECAFYDREHYKDISIIVVFDSYTEFDYSSNQLTLTFKDLSSLLFDKIVRVTGDLVLIVV